MIIESVFIFALIACLCSTDITAFGQFMICRPIFCAPLFGFLMGDVSLGLWIGMIVEMVWINAIPMGVAVPVDISSISILSVYWACNFFPGIEEAGILGLILGIPFAYFYKEMDVAGRNFNIKIMHWVEVGIKRNKESRINSGIFISLFLFLLRAYLFYLLVMVVGGWIFQGIYLQLPAFVITGFKKAWYLLPILGFGAVLYNFRNIKIPFLSK